MINYLRRLWNWLWTYKCLNCKTYMAKHYVDYGWDILLPTYSCQKCHKTFDNNFREIK